MRRSGIDDLVQGRRKCAASAPYPRWLRTFVSAAIVLQLIGCSLAPEDERPAIEVDCTERPDDEAVIVLEDALGGLVDGAKVRVRPLRRNESISDVRVCSRATGNYSSFSVYVIAVDNAEQAIEIHRLDDATWFDYYVDSDRNSPRAMGAVRVLDEYSTEGALATCSIEGGIVCRASLPIRRFVIALHLFDTDRTESSTDNLRLTRSMRDDLEALMAALVPALESVADQDE